MNTNTALYYDCDHACFITTEDLQKSYNELIKSGELDLDASFSGYVSDCVNSSLERVVTLGDFIDNNNGKDFKVLDSFGDPISDDETIEEASDAYITDFTLDGEMPVITIDYFKA